MSARIEMPHAGHFICGDRCRFRLNTFVNGFIVSTVGEMANPGVFENGSYRMRRDSDPAEPVGHQRMYETMVFNARPTRWEPETKPEDRCCQYEVADASNTLDFEGYNHPGDAVRGHEVMVAKYAAISNASAKRSFDDAVGRGVKP